MEDSAREKRKEEISRALAFIQSPLAYPDPDSYQDFLTHLVCNLLEEGNAFFQDEQWEEAIKEFTEGLNVSRYAEGEDIRIPEALLESLYVKRAAACHSVGKYDQGIEDCNSALEVCKESRRALYRKALCLKELGKFREAYDCTSVCLLSNPQDKQVNKLAQELSIQLGMKIRKPYVSSKLSHSNLGNGVNPRSVVAAVGAPKAPFTSTPPPSPVVPLRVEDSEVMGDDLDSLLDSLPPEQGLTEAAFSDSSRSLVHTLPPVLPAPTPQLPPAFFSSALSQLNSLDSFSAGDSSGAASPALNVLDDLSTSGNGAGADALNITQNSSTMDYLNRLDSLDSLDDFLDETPSAAAAAAEEINQPQTELNAGGQSLDLLDEVDVIGAVSPTNGQSGDVPKANTKATKQLDSLDSLDLFSTVEDVGAASAADSVWGSGLDSLSDFSTNGLSDSQSAAAAAAPVTQSPKNHYKAVDSLVSGAASNPLSSTHEFLQACSLCFPREGVGIYSYVHKPELTHSCKQDILLCRRKGIFPLDWTRVRQIPFNASFSGPFVLCRNLLKSGDLGVCEYGERCTFAYNQLEIDVWTEERRGTLDRNLLFETTAVKLDPVNSIICLLQENKGMFIFLCQKCYDSKPRIVSKRFVDNQAVCSNLDVRHNFDANKCLAFVVRTHNINYSKVRPLSVLCHLDLCRHAIRYGCQLEDSCQFAHSVIELKTWRVQRHTGISPDEIVKISMKYHEKQEQNFKKEKEKRLSFGGGGSKSKGGGGGGGKSLNMKMKFACAQCWREGLISEPDKALKYCNAKARHTWTKERRVLLVRSSERSKWVQVRPLPHTKNFPLHYDMCAQILRKKKCNYTGNCTFAHSQEEREMWMYMKNNDLVDMQQVYDMWLALAAQSRQADGAGLSQPNAEEKYIMMPTDYAELMSGFHCRLCGKHSNSERQWQQHISSEKHKDRVFSCEGEEEALTWNYRFPGTRFKICPEVDDGCPDGVSCDYAHSPEELQEWIERRDFLRQKLAKAREDMLIMPDELDFGKYNFLLQD
ncbi:zinc finger CCCH domain-containing protein 7B isoform X1 [Kryptolebias marmoratus]|uniref:Zinc finger CCCH-type containing 7Ba n=1 Tax=Kryptolebias marmoratus TaxID=37003 RepID=A0A3Q3AT55_KRYMA|nr:zinc finger CCCH domain-containing protein 7B isoform X1 [Kryptolebias marmoratus]